jgi:serine protease Do
MVKELLPNLLVNGHLERGWLGVNVFEQPRTGQGTPKGAIIKDVFRGSPAAAAQIKAGDRLMAVNGRPVESYLQLLRMIAFLPPGSDVTLSMVRGAVAREVRVKLGHRPPTESAPPGAHSDRLGMVVRDLPADGASDKTKAAPAQGVVISTVMPGGPAARAGLSVGDLISEVNRRPVHDIRSFDAALDRTGSERRVLVRYQRGETVRYVILSLR